MSGDHELELDLIALDDHDDDAVTYVVVRGFQPGCTNKLGAILATHGIEDTVVIRMNSEAAAIRRWRRELAAGNRVACLGLGPVEERMAYTERLRRSLLLSLQSSAPPTAPSSPRSDRSVRSQRILTPPTKRMDSVYIPETLRASRLSLATGVQVEGIQPSASNTQATRIVALGDTEASGNNARGTPNDEQETGIVPVAPDAEDNRAISASTTSYTTVSPASQSQATNVTESSALINYAPPSDQGVGYRPNELPADGEVRGLSGSWPWYVVLKSKRPGIYANWADAKASNDGSVRDSFFKKGTTTYAEAIQLWVRERDANRIVKFA